MQSFKAIAPELTVAGSLLPVAPVVHELRSPEDGLITQIEPRAVGHGVIWLGGGRSQSDDTVDPAVGFVIPVKPGQRVSKGQLLGTVHARDEAGAALGLQALRKAIRFGERARPQPLVGERIAAE